MLQQQLILLLILGPLLLSACNYQQHVSIVVDSESQPFNYSSANESFYQCTSLNEMFDLLLNHTCCSNANGSTSTDVFIKPGNYRLNLSYTLKNLCNVHIISQANNPATIQCEPNVYKDPKFDTGLAFIAVTNLTIEHLTILGCAMNHTSTSRISLKEDFIVFHSALFIQNSTNVFLNYINISDSDGIGLSFYDTNGRVTIENSFFIHNLLRFENITAKVVGGGGGIYIEFTKCSPGQIACDPHSNLRNSDSAYLVKNCTFERNLGFFNATDLADNITADTFVHLGLGGALSLWLDGQARNNSLIIISCIFKSNVAESGGALTIQSRLNVTHTYIVISKCCFISNTAKKHGGGGISIGYVIYQTGGEALHNSYTISHCIFEQNQAVRSLGGAIVMYFSREPGRTQPTNSFRICNCTFEGNMAKYGSAIQANKEFYDSIAVGIILTLIINNCTFTSNNIINSQSSTSDYSSIGAVASTDVNIAFGGKTSFLTNDYTALVIDSSTVEFTEHSVTVFQNNSGVHGGAIMLIDGAWIKIYSQSNVSFLHNSALISGGAIHVDVGTPFDHLGSHVCFIRYYQEDVPPNEWLTNFTFKDNRVNEGKGKDLFANTLNPCNNNIQLFKELIGVDISIRRHMSISPMNSNANNIATNQMSTSPEKFEFYSNRSGSIEAPPGKLFELPMHLVDELGQNVSATMFIASCIGSSSAKVLSPYEVTDGPIQIEGKPNETCLLHLQTDVDYPVTTTTLITLVNCPPGFIFNDEAAQCTCLVNSPNENSVITGCYQKSFQAYFDPTYWIGYQTDEALNLLYGSCPFQYCYSDNIAQDQFLPQEANKMALDKFVCSSTKRTGELCGHCISGYSVAINSPTFGCHKCDTHHPIFGILILFGTYIIPVTILFYIIMAFNVRTTTGPISAFLFYSQVISSTYRFAFDYYRRDGTKLEVSNIVIAIYSFSNLDFFSYDKIGTYCIFQNAGTVDILAFNLLLSFYPLLLVFIFFLFIEYCRCKPKFFHKFRFSRSIAHGLCAFLVLCFAKLSVTAFAILKSTEIFHIDGKTYKTVVYFQGDIEYFKEWPYILYAMGAILTVITVTTIPTLILVLHPIIMKCASYLGLGDSKIINIINKVLFVHKLKPVLDSFQGGYKDNMRLFAGLQNFVYRILFFYIAALPSTVKTHNSTLLMLGFLLCIIILIHMLTMPFKQYKDNAVYSLIYVLMLAIVIVEYYRLYDSQDIQQGNDNMSWLGIVMLLLPLMCVFIYCLYKLLIIVNKFTRKHACRNSNNEPELVSNTN